MDWSIIRSLAIVLFLLANFHSAAQEGPQVPCVGCENLEYTPLPETGSWFNPDQSGSGINLEVQNGHLVGYYYVYDEAGSPVWFLFSGELIRSEQHGVQWEFSATMQRFEGGNCPECDYQAPGSPISGPVIRLEFLQRSNLRVTVDDHPHQYFVPIIFGSKSFAFFKEVTPYLFPEYGGQFVQIIKPGDENNAYYWEKNLISVSPSHLVPGDIEDRIVIYDITPIGPEDWATQINCALDSESGLPVCKLVQGEREFTIPIANMSDTRFLGESEDGWTVEGYRIDYD